MALPANIDVVTLKGSYMDFTGQPITGTVSFTPTAPHIKHLESDAIILAKKVDVTVQADGTFTASLPVTNDPDIVPSFQYAVTENVGGVRRNYNIEVPVEMAGETVDLSDLVPVGAVPVGTTALTRAIADAIYALKGETGGGTGGGEAGESPVLQVAGGYIQWKYPSQQTWTNLVALTALQGPKGDKGDAGTAATVNVGTVTTGAAGSSAEVTQSGTATARVLDFVIPRGNPGAKGDTGTAGVGIQSVTDNEDGTMTVLLTNGTSSVIDLPAGLKGDTGDAGESVVVTEVPASAWPPAADPNPLHWYVKVAD